MSDCGHGTDSFAITPHCSAEPLYPSLDAALEAARPVLVRLYSGFQRRRQAQITEFAASFQFAQGCPPTATDLAAGLETRISEPTAIWYLSRSNGRDRGDDLSHSILDSPKSRNGGRMNRDAVTRLPAKHRPNNTDMQKE